jgi:Fic family protein
MTYLKNGTEYLDNQEMQVYKAVEWLNKQGQTTNNSQVAAAAGISRATVRFITAHLRARGFLRDISKGAAYHWRTTAREPVTEHMPAVTAEPEG